MFEAESKGNADLLNSSSMLKPEKFFCKLWTFIFPESFERELISKSSVNLSANFSPLVLAFHSIEFYYNEYCIIILNLEHYL